MSSKKDNIDLREKLSKEAWEGMAKRRKKGTKRPMLNNLQSLHYKMKDNYQNGRAPTTLEIASIDITETVNNFIAQAVRDRFYFSVLFTGAQSGGKSISNLTLAYKTAKYLMQLNAFKGLKKKDFSMNDYITYDEVEFNELIMKNVEDCIGVIDELNEMNTGGDNTTVVRQIYISNAEVNAQKFVYRFCATPRVNSFYEHTSLLVFRSIGMDRANKLNYWIVYYNDPADTEKYPIGLYISDISEILEEKWYQKYKKKKFARMNLLNKHGVRDVRELRNAKVILQVFNALKDSTKFGTKIKTETISGQIDLVLHREKLIYTSLAKANTLEPIKALISLKHAIELYKIEQGKLNPEKPNFREKYEMYKELIKRDEKTLNDLVEFREKLVKILNEYEAIK